MWCMLTRMSCTTDGAVTKIDRERVFAQKIIFDAAPDLSADTWEAQLRVSPDFGSDLIVAFSVDTADAAAGVLVLRLTEVQTAAITQDVGWYDLLRTTGGSDVSAFDRPLQAEIRNMPTT